VSVNAQLLCRRYLTHGMTQHWINVHIHPVCQIRRWKAAQVYGSERSHCRPEAREGEKEQREAVKWIEYACQAATRLPRSTHIRWECLLRRWYPRQK